MQMRMFGISVHLYLYFIAMYKRYRDDEHINKGARKSPSQTDLSQLLQIWDTLRRLSKFYEQALLPLFLPNYCQFAL